MELATRAKGKADLYFNAFIAFNHLKRVYLESQSTGFEAIVRAT